jgi:DNA-binding CsgD family transcriptional regulator
VAVGVIGRDAELAAVAAFLDALADGAGVLAIEGEAGIGKTTIWEHGVSGARDRGARVLIARPCEAEAGLSFAGLTDLFGAAPAALFARLPEPQREALAAALLQAPAPARGMDERAVCAAVLSLLRSMAAARPVVVAVDDAQWLDSPTARALTFALRRLHGEPVGFLVTVRASGVPLPSFDRAAGTGRRVVAVGPMTVAGLHRVIMQHNGSSLPRPALVQVTRVCGGNPFYAIEMAAEMNRHPPSGGRVPVPASVTGLVESRLARLPAATQRALLAAAALTQPTVSLVGGTALTPAEDDGLVSVERGRVRFAHPLFASAVYGQADAPVRRRLHRRLARLVTDPEERARHLALGARPPDAAVAAELDAAAELAARRGACDAAAGLVELALRLSPPDDAAGQCRRLVAASRFWFNAGDLARAQAMLEQAVASTPAGPLRSQALQLLGEVHARRSSFSEAFDCAFRALAEAGGEPARRAVVELDLTYCCINMVDFDGAQLHAQAAVAAAELSGRSEVLADALAVLTVAEFLGGRGLNEQRLARALALEDPALGAESFVMRPGLISGMVLLWTGHPDQALTRLGAFRAQALARGEEIAVPVLTLFLVWACLWRGDIEGAARCAGEALEAATLAGDAAASGMALAASALVHAHDGSDVLARQQSAEALKIFQDLRWPSGTIWPLWALGLTELACGNPAAVDAALGPVADMITSAGTDVVLGMFVPDEIEALIELGHLGQARALTGWLEERGRQQSRPWALAVAGRCRGLLHAADGDNDAALAALWRAVAEHDRLDGMPFDRARTLLVLGRVLRRAGKRTQARAALAEAHAVFRQAGALAWAGRARAEENRLGGRGTGSEVLTPTEARVAELAAMGLSNRAIAEQAFMTVKTVEANLTRVYRKLGVRSRAALAHVLSQTSHPPG